MAFENNVYLYMIKYNHILIQNLDMVMSFLHTIIIFISEVVINWCILLKPWSSYVLLNPYSQYIDHVPCYPMQHSEQVSFQVYKYLFLQTTSLYVLPHYLLDNKAKPETTVCSSNLPFNDIYVGNVHDKHSLTLNTHTHTYILYYCIIVLLYYCIIVILYYIQLHAHIRFSLV